KAFVQQHFNPKAIIATSGPDQGKTFSDAVGKRNTEGIMVPEDWWAGAKTYQNSLFVKTYLQMFHGKAQDISTDSAEAYSVGQTFYQVVKKTHTLNNGTIIKGLHKYHFNTVEGPNWYSKYGQPHGQRFLVQWLKGKPTPVYPPRLATHKPEFPKPSWK
ncbi:MAG TPA: ABC transporter substrate-binding protein, partial [Herpetosiphonaceae bacterium]|nr:ABC transporter substrate-binding protein [Herpetosiphonaceae bacterium]